MTHAPTSYRRTGRFEDFVTRSVVFVAVLVVLLLTVGAAPAVADPARPTNYESVVITVEPSTEGVRFEVVGGMRS